ncbi:hypothetical protein WICPIJ_005048 [Wickerhamomyces pijperi]|uniref:Autophagy-related protein 27 n=1 Tax=Wickerhamomyces pijperi TaxID=599730 RepID=A0A9P8TLH0_WICPI|nr:hypothetical protein WICPIJ_005048 [Wickerhamomyces pijperi]
MLSQTLNSLLTLCVLFQLSSALHCDQEGLAAYRLQEVLKDIKSKTFNTDTPPSVSTFTWYLNLCGTGDQDFPDPECPKNSQICGVKSVSLPGQSPIKTEIITLGNGLNYQIEESTKEFIDLKLDDTNWGSNTISSNFHLVCANEENIDVSFNDNTLKLTLSTPGACLKEDKEHTPPPPPPPPGSDDSWGWFTWFFILGVLFTGGYIIGSAWVGRGSDEFQDAIHDFIDTLKSLLANLPEFIGEIFNKVFGNSGNSGRGGYTSV